MRIFTLRLGRELGWHYSLVRPWSRAPGSWKKRWSSQIIPLQNWEINIATDLTTEQLGEYLVKGSAPGRRGSSQCDSLFSSAVKYYPMTSQPTKSWPAVMNVGNYLAQRSYQQWDAGANHPAALNNLAYTYMLAESNLSEAINLAYKAVTLEPKASYLDTLGYGYYLVKDYDKALHYLLQAADQADHSKLADIYHHLVLVYGALNDQAEVDFYQQKILELTVGD